MNRLASSLGPLLLLVVAALTIPSNAAAAAPTVSSPWVTGVTANSAVLRAEVNPQGEGTRYHFEYLTAAAYEANLAGGGEGFEGARMVPSAVGSGLGSGSTATPVSFTLIGPSNPLTPGTAYRYRVVASNPSGTTPSAASVLRTESGGPPPGLPDGRAWEMVSPADKGGGAIAGPGQLFGGGDIQAASGGGGLTYGSATAFADPSSAPPVSQYLSLRGPAGWSTQNISAPAEAGAYGDVPDGAPFRVFAPDLAAALVLDGRRCAALGTCSPSYSLWSGGALNELPSAPGLRFEGAAADLHHLVFAADAGLYMWSGGGLEALSSTAGAELAAPRGAIAEDGSRVYFTTPDGTIYLREGAATLTLPKSGSGAAFAAASEDGSVAYFTRAGVLYRFIATGPTSVPIASGVSGALAVSADGSRVYYQDAAGLQYWHEGTVRQVAAGADAALPSDYPPATGTSRLGAGGTVLAFLSATPIGEYDNTDAESGLPDIEAYIYDAATGSLLCASCNPSGERPAGSAAIPGALQNGTTSAYSPRALSADGRRLFFTTADALQANDTNHAVDVYQWEAAGEGDCAELPGCVRLISSGRGEGGRFLDASANGDDAFFLTGDSLVASDPGSIDAYDARVGGGLPEPQAPIPCIADACQPLPSPPEDPTAGTSVPSTANPAPRYEKERRRRRKHHHRRGHRRHHRGGHRGAR